MKLPQSVDKEVFESEVLLDSLVLSQAPVLATAMIFQATAQAISMAAQNAVANQQLTQILAQAVTTMAVTAILAEEFAGTAGSPLQVATALQPVPVTAAAVPIPLTSPVTDAVTQANAKVLGDAPAIALANLYQATAQALANAAHNATNAQQQASITAQAATTMGVATLYSIDTAAIGKQTQNELSGN